jgi:hypothetical protein
MNDNSINKIKLFSRGGMAVLALAAAIYLVASGTEVPRELWAIFALIFAGFYGLETVAKFFQNK